MSKYLAINIGPISKTFSMARKPREFWVASYLFSYLMECILEDLSKMKSLTMISPFYCGNKKENKDSTKLGVGLYPDRSFYLVNSDIDIEKFLDDTILYFAGKVNLDYNLVKRYFNIMVACNEYESSSDAIEGLNLMLNYMELDEMTCDSDDYDKIYEYIRNTTVEAPSPLFEIAFGKRFFKIESMEEIAKGDATQFVFSYQKYVCIIQADGDGMGKIVKSKEMEGHLYDFSHKLMDFGKEACKEILAYGGRPIYAGGDDLLFLAPICGKGNKGCILDLIDTLDEKFKDVKTYLRDNKINYNTSMSYGVSIIYNKYPLYEAWKTASSMLFEKAKKIDGKNAIAINLRKNSGADLELAINKDSDLYTTFKNIIINTPKKDIVSAIAHKIRTNNILLDNLPKENIDDSSVLSQLQERVEAFYDKIIDIQTKDENEVIYMTLTQDAFVDIYKDVLLKKTKEEDDKDEKIKDIDKIISLFYSMLRIAKFIKGEEVKNE